MRRKDTFGFGGLWVSGPDASLATRQMSYADGDPPVAEQCRALRAHSGQEHIFRSAVTSHEQQSEVWRMRVELDRVSESSRPRTVHSAAQIGHTRDGAASSVAGSAGALAAMNSSTC